MRVEAWLRFFRSHPEKRLFSLTDLQNLTGERAESLSVQLSRMVASDIIRRPAKGWYENPFSQPTTEEVAMVLRYPSYLSLEYALSTHGIISQTVQTLTLVTIKLPYTVRTHGAIYEYHQIRKDLFWGYTTNGMVNMADPEKALLDFLYLRYIRGRGVSRNIRALVDELRLDAIDVNRLRRYGTVFGTTMMTTISQLGLENQSSPPTEEPTQKKSSIVHSSETTGK
jgi:predicted transcriptional regulator of viral defense system